LSKFRVFDSSPVDDIVEYRDAIYDLALAANARGRFDVFLYESHDIPTIPGRTIVESIFDVAGHDFDAFFIFFKDRLGAGTQAEYEYFRDILRPANPNIKLWWAQIHCQKNEDCVNDLLAEINPPPGHLGMPTFDGPRTITEPSHLANRFFGTLLDIGISLSPDGS